MNYTVNISLPKPLAEAAKLQVKEGYFSSLSELIRTSLRQFLVSSKEEITHLSPAAERRYKKAVEDIKKGRNIYKPEDADEFMRMLVS